MTKKKFVLLACFVIALGIVLSISAINLTSFDNGSKVPDSPNQLSFANVVNDTGTTNFADQVFNEDFFIIQDAIVNVTNCTINGDVRVADVAQLYLLNSTITGTLTVDEYSNTQIVNSTINKTQILLEFFDLSPFGPVYRGEINITQSSRVETLTELGNQGNVFVDNSTITTMALLGASHVFITNSTISNTFDQAKPIVKITNPVSIPGIFEATTGDRFINLTWTGYDSPIIDGFLNISFSIYVDGQLKAQVNGSGYHDVYEGGLSIPVATGVHEITINATDGAGNVFTAETEIEVIDYSIFPIISLILVILVIGGITIGVYFYVRHRRKKPDQRFYAIDKVAVNSFKDKKIGAILIFGINILPGLFIFLTNFAMNTLSWLSEGAQGAIPLLAIDMHRTSVSIVFTSLWLMFYPLIFSVMFAPPLITGMKNGVLSWFLSKPIRRWEYYWGRVLPSIFILAVGSAIAGFSIAFSGLPFFLTRPEYWVDIFSIGGFSFLMIFFATLTLFCLTLAATVILHQAFGIIIPIIMTTLGSLLMLLPILTGNELLLLIAIPTFYAQEMGTAWIVQGVDLYGTASLGMLIGREIIEVTLNPYFAMMILLLISLGFLFFTQIYIQRKDFH